jgi:DNA polymerase III gamma/tau subunit
LASVNFCQGRIGDTLEEEVARYGKPVHEAAEDFAMFKQAPYYITVHFHDKKTDAITYVKAGSASENAFSSDEIDRLLRINGGDHEWEQSKNSAGRPLWKTDDKMLQAVYSESKFLVITTAAYLTRLQAAKKKAKEKETVAEETGQKPASTHQEKAKSEKKNPSPKKSPTPSPKKSVATLTKKSAAASAKKSTAASAKKSTAASAKKSAAASAKKSAAASTKKGAAASTKKGAAASTKKSATSSVKKRGTTTSTKKGAAPAKKSPASPEEQGD